jgi:hypothetical protein
MGPSDQDRFEPGREPCHELKALIPVAGGRVEREVQLEDDSHLFSSQILCRDPRLARRVDFPYQ